jgi:NTE family protein
MVHVGVLKVLRDNRVPVDCIAGVSAGAIAAAAYASGRPCEEIGRIACSMRFADVARWTIPWMGFAASERMERFLRKALQCHTFEGMSIPLSGVATDVVTGEPVVFRDSGDVCLPIRASCSYPGIFQPVRHAEHLLVDGAISMEVPALAARELGATCVISVHLPAQDSSEVPGNVVQVINRCFEIMHHRTENTWRQHSDFVIEPDIGAIEWDGFASGPQLIEAGEKAATQALPHIQTWLQSAATVPGNTIPVPRERFGRCPSLPVLDRA